MKVLFLLPGGMIEWPVPEALQKDFNFQIFSGNVRINGYFQSDNMHFQYAHLAGMLFQSADTPAPTVRKDLN